MMKKSFKIAFTVVLTIIVILTILYISLPPRKGGPSNALVTQVYLSPTKEEADIYFDKHGMFATDKTADCADPYSLFATPTTTAMIEAIETLNEHKAACYATGNTWAISIKLRDNSGTLCADSKGFLGSGIAYTDGWCR